jgi:phage terminase large subunit
MSNLDITEYFLPIVEGSYRYYLYHGGRGGSKSNSIARALLALAGTRQLRILCTREIQNTIKHSVHKLLSDVIHESGLDKIYKIQKDTITSSVGSEFIFAGLRHNINEIKSTEGIDICWVEEGQNTSKESLDVLIPTIRKQGSFIIFSFNRLRELDAVWEMFALKPEPNTFICKLTYRDNQFISETLLAEMDRDRRNNPEDYLHKWEGEPVVQTEKAIISRIEIADAVNREVDTDGAVEIGVDVARFGADSTVLSKRKGLKLLEVREFTKLSTVEVAGKVIDFVDGNKRTVIKIDDTGVGGGVTDLLLSYGYNVTGLNFGSSAKDRDKYNNLISEAWFEFKNQIKDVQLVTNDRLSNELATREWKIDNKGRRCVESKDDYKKRGYLSPDVADSVLICFYNSTNVFNDKFDLTTGLTKESFY